MLSLADIARISDPVEKAKAELDFARANLAGARKMAELGDLLPMNGPQRCEERLREALEMLRRAEAALARLIQ